MALYPLENWQKTRDSLHQASQVIGAFRKVGVERDPKFFQHHALTPLENGLTTKETLFGELILDMKNAEVHYQGQVIPLAGQNQVSLTDRLLALGYQAEIDRSQIMNTDPFEIDPTQAAHYTESLYSIYETVSAFRASLEGFVTPLVVYPHHFDLSFLWFPAKHDDEYDPHVNFGFAPFSEGIDHPYFYTYAYPVPEGYQKMDLPPGVKWAETFTGTFHAYHDLLKESDPLLSLKTIFEQIQTQCAALMA